VVWLDFMAPHRHFIVDVTVTSARTNTNVPRIGARLPLPASLKLGAKHGKLDAELRTYALLGMSSVQSVHDYYPFALEDGGRLAPMAAEFADRMAILVAIRRFPGKGAADSRSSRIDNYVRMQHLVRLSVELLMFLSAFLGGYAARIHATSLCCSSCYLGFLSPRQEIQEGSADVVACLPVPHA
jgi:MoxR-like ATPase